MAYTCPSCLIGYSVFAAVFLLVAGVGYRVASPYITGLMDPLGVADRFVGGICDAAVTWFGVHCRELHVFLNDLGVPFGVIVKQVLVPFVVGGAIAEMAFSSIVAAAKGRTDAEAKRAAWLFVYNSAVAVGFAATRQRFWAPPARLAEKPVTLGVLLVPCVLGWHVLTLCNGKYTGRHKYYAAFSGAAVAYHVFLAQVGPNKDSLRGLATAYGAAKLFLVLAVFGEALDMLPWLVPAVAWW